MSSDSWRDLPPTRKQIDLLISMAFDSFEKMTRGHASELIEDDSEDIAAAKTPAISKPVIPGGSCSTMKSAKISSVESNDRPS